MVPPFPQELPVTAVDYRNERAAFVHIDDKLNGVHYVVSEAPTGYELTYLHPKELHLEHVLFDKQDAPETVKRIFATGTFESIRELQARNELGDFENRLNEQ